MEEAKPRSRRRHSDELKAEVVAACQKPGASVAAIALEHGLNANLVHNWRRLARREQTPGTGADAMAVSREFIAMPLPSQPVHTPLPDICIELRRGPATVTVSWPLQAASECGAWLREWLK
ncbi:IS66-like element accessory protein TnpA [Caldimonas tepidiphila]|uniref:IS66-like element accessory protein TnpA n=1 Tax=Caldimonas tepidiphila TaxID=2315841 RepID=UPI000E5AF15C|nr:transposase [Caldimonas tepidiphila]